jgi:hypothetical protein
VRHLLSQAPRPSRTSLPQDCLNGLVMTAIGILTRRLRNNCAWRIWLSLSLSLSLSRDIRKGGNASGGALSRLSRIQSVISSRVSGLVPKYRCRGRCRRLRLHLERRSAFHQSVALHLRRSRDGGRGRTQNETTLADFDLSIRVGDLEVRQNGADGPRQIARLRVFTADLVL